MSIRNELRTLRLQVPIRAREDSGAPSVDYRDAGTVRCAVFPASSGFLGGEPEVCVGRYTVLCVHPKTLLPDWRLLDGGEVYTVEEAVSSRRWCVARCRKEERI